MLALAPCATAALTGSAALMHEAVQSAQTTVESMRENLVKEVAELKDGLAQRKEKLKTALAQRGEQMAITNV